MRLDETKNEKKMKTKIFPVFIISLIIVLERKIQIYLFNMELNEVKLSYKLTKVKNRYKLLYSHSLFNDANSQPNSKLTPSN